MATIRSVSYTNPLELPTSNCGFSSKPQIFPQNPSFLPFPKSSPVPFRSARSHRFKSLGISCNQSVKGGSSALGVREEAQRPWKTSDARLVLEDGSIWRAKSFGVSGTQVGEVVFNTSLTGYQEILTDPSYAGQFVLMTNPHIGNTGVNSDDEESSRCFLAGLIIRNLSIWCTFTSICFNTSNWRCSETLGDYLAKRNIMGIYDVDTRAITRRLRQDGSLIGVLSTEESKTDEDLLEMARRWKIVGVDLISGVSCDAPYEWTDKTDPEWEFQKNQIFGENLHVVAYDFGIKQNILRRLASYGCKITVVPSNWPASETLKMKPDGVLFSNGPGDPSAVPYAVETVKAIIGNVPVFGICMGHQLIGQALGGKTFKMKFGHHGGNHPVCDLRSGRVDISAQNHNYAVDPESLPAGVEVTHINLNDNSCAGLAFPTFNLMSLQYHPESSPGPHDSDPAFGEFLQLMKAVKANKS
ncbi:Carbamoyl-phosphate synthase small chain, chloroplastic [Ananas comosus]|uniref:Carbamoyl phosphate synthase small chain, chloroplastic n=1 Tax=Ananas comosus TaxID=4615 RepID=A0A199URX7_ANACO|nr:Carbamoyl-phosphate synthase small chain, chloroplastic [Ananas comosus]